MNRRQFLARALVAVPVLLAGEELLELLAPKRTIFLPPRVRFDDTKIANASFINGLYADDMMAAFEYALLVHLPPRAMKSTYAGQLLAFEFKG